MSHYFSKHQRGFTLAELAVSIGIVFVILTVVVFNQSAYTDASALSNLADQIASTVSQAQAYGVAVRELNPGSANFSIAYGLSLSLLDPSYTTSYLFFADRNGNKAYDGTWACATGDANECLEKTAMLRGNYLDSICIIQSSGNEQCNSAKRTDITFLRPSLEAQLTVFNNGGQSYDPGNMRGVRMVLKSPKGLVRSVAVYENGQISVQ